jgi:WD40 repeat protein
MKKQPETLGRAHRGTLLALLALAASAWGRQEGKQDPKKDGPIPIEAVKLDRSVDFKADILPILKSNCISCHNAKDSEADLVLETPKAMIQGGESGPAVVPGQGDKSLLLKLASLQKKPHMPPKDNKMSARHLTSRELGLLRLWIDQGAKGAVTADVEPPKFQAPPATWNPILAVALDPDGQLAACGRAGRLFLYSIPAGRLAAQPADPKAGAGLAHKDAVHSAAFSPDGTLLATGGYREIKIWKKDLPEKKGTLESAGEIKAAAVSPDGKRIAVAGADSAIRIFDVATGKRSAELKGHAEPVTALRFAGPALLSGSADKSVRAWKLEDGSLVATIETPSPVAAVESLADGKQLAAGGADGVVRVWGLEGEKPALLKEIKAAATDLRAAPGGLLVAGADGKAALYTLENGQKAREVAHGAPIAALAVSPDGKRWLTAGGTSAKLWNGETGQAVAELKTDGSAKRRDNFAQAHLTFTTAEVAYCTGALKAAQDAKTKEEAEVKAATDALAPVDKDAKDKEAALAKARADRAGLEKAAADSGPAIEAAKARLEAAAKTLSMTASEEALKGAEADKAASDQVLAAATKAADEARPKAEAAGKAAAATAQAVDDAKKKADEAAKAIAAAAQGDEAKRKAEAAAKAVSEAVQSLEELKKKAEADKAAADQVLAAATRALDEAKLRAETAAKALLLPRTGIALARAQAEKEAADKALVPLAQAAQQAKSALDQATKAAADAKAKADAAAMAAADAKARHDASAKAAADAKGKLDAAARAVEEARKALGKADAAIKEAGDDEAKKKAAEEAKKKAAEASAKAQTEQAGAQQASEKAVKEQKAAEAMLAQAEAGRKAADETARKAEADQKAADAAHIPAARAATDAKAKADAAAAALAKAKAEADQARAGFEAAKADAEKALKAAEAQQKDAAAKRDAAKKAEDAAQQAFDQAQLSLQSAHRRVAGAKDSVLKAEKAIQEAGARLEQEKRAQQKAEADRKAAAETLAKAARPVRPCAFSPDGALVALGGEDGLIYFFGAERGDEGPVFSGHGKPVAAIGLAPDGSRLSLGTDGSVAAGAVLPSWKLARTIDAVEPRKTPEDRVMALAFSPDGKTLASGGGTPSRDGELALWNAADGKLIREIAGAHSDTVYDVAFSADGAFIASASSDRFAKIHDARSGRFVRAFEGHTHHVLGVGWNRTGRTIATGGADEVVKVWDVTSGQQVRTIQGFAKQATGLLYLPFGDQFVVTAGGTPVRLVGENGQNVRNFDAGGTFVYAAALSGDGKVVAAGGLDGTLRLWRTENGQAAGSFPAAAR